MGNRVGAAMKINENNMISVDLIDKEAVFFPMK